MYKTNHNNLDFARIKNHKDNTNYSISLIHPLKSLPHSIATLLDSSIENNDSSLKRYFQENHHHFTSRQLCQGQNLRIVWIQAVFFRHAQKRVSLSFSFKCPINQQNNHSDKATNKNSKMERKKRPSPRKKDTMQIKHHRH